METISLKTNQANLIVCHLMDIVGDYMGMAHNGMEELMNSYVEANLDSSQLETMANEIKANLGMCLISLEMQEELMDSIPFE